MDELGHLRDALDTIDANLVDLLAQRQDIVRQVTRFKRAGTKAVRDDTRERQVVGTAVERGRRAGLAPWFVTSVYRLILDESRRHQEAVILAQGQPQLVTYQGTEGSWSHQATHRHFGDVRSQGLKRFEDVVRAVEEGRAEFGVLPVENVIAGTIHASVDRISSSSLHVVGEEFVTIEHVIAAPEPIEVHEIRRVLSQAPALAQCQRWLLSHDVEQVAVADTAMAAQRVARDGDRTQTALCSEDAARRFGLHVVARGVADQQHNQTRFFVVCREPAERDDRIGWRTTLHFTTRHEAGALTRCLEVLSSRGIDMSRLESRPVVGDPGAAAFLVDCNGHREEDVVLEALQTLAARARHLRVLGSYPRRGLPGQGPAPLRSPAAATPERGSVMFEASDHPLCSRKNRPEDSVVQVGSAAFGADAIGVIAGPAVIESREEIMACAEMIGAFEGCVLRGAAFYLSDQPGEFQGYGLRALDWLAEAGRAHGLPTMTEVLEPEQVPEVAERVEFLQIGGRNMQNFALLKAVGRSHRPVLLTRGVMSSVEEWLRAAEYILAEGNQQVVLAEAGTGLIPAQGLKRSLDLSSVPSLRERVHLPVVVEPTAVGRAELAIPLARAALAAGAQGLVVDVHPQPVRARVGATSSLRFDHFQSLMNGLRG